MRITKEDDNIVPLLKWFKNDYEMDPKRSFCHRCVNRRQESHHNSKSNGDSRSLQEAVKPIMQVIKILVGVSWKVRKEVFGCNTCNYDYTFSRYSEILGLLKLKPEDAANGLCFLELY